MTHNPAQPQSPSPQAGTPDPEIRHWQDILSNPVRQLVLYTLSDREEPASLSALTEIVRAESKTLPFELSVELDVADDDRRRLRTWLFREHLLPMQRFGVIEYDDDSESVALARDVTVSVDSPRY